jgi:putative tryptophan/tyrosine transport system substrate-binding protein
LIAPRPALAIALAAGLLAAPLAIEAQPTAKVPRIGVLLAGSQGDNTRQIVEAFRQGLRDLGHVEGRNITIEYRFAEGRLDRSFHLASELARLPVDVIVAPGTALAQAARKATTTIPIVLVTAGNPVGDGLIKSFARPGGNATGLTMAVGQEIGGKLLELLKEAVPTVSRVAVLWNPLTAPHAVALKETAPAARALGLALRPLNARRPDEIDGAFTAMSRARADGLVVFADPVFLSVRARIADLAMKGHLPTISELREHAEAGGLLRYGPSLPDLFRRAAGYVDRLLKGANPADLPVERPSKFDLVVNLKTAKALGLSIPTAMLARVDQIIE